MPTALVTGASSGLGAEFARQLAERGADIVLVARDRVALESLSARLGTAYGIECEVIVADLTRKRDITRVVRRLGDRARPIDVLVNNAGFGLPLSFDTNDIEAEAAHLEIHVEAPMRLMHAALPVMLERGRGRIINLSSVAGFLPRSTYGAVKGWLISFSRWADAAYRARGVTVTAVCPGFTHTGFHERMGLSPGAEGVPDWMWLQASDVVEQGLRDAARGKPVSIPSARYKVLVALARALPASIAAKAAARGR